MAKEFRIKLCDGFKITYNGESWDVANLSELWQAIKWDNDDEETKKAREVVIRELFCFGCIDMTPAMPKGNALYIEVIPCKD